MRPLEVRDLNFFWKYDLIFNKILVIIDFWALSRRDDTDKPYKKIFIKNLIIVILATPESLWLDL